LEGRVVVAVNSPWWWCAVFIPFSYLLSRPLTVGARAANRSPALVPAARARSLAFEARGEVSWWVSRMRRGVRFTGEVNFSPSGDVNSDVGGGREPSRSEGTADADESFVGALYAEHGAALFGYAVRLTGGDRGRAEDIVQETLLRAWRQAGSLDRDERPLRPWLFTVAAHLATDQRRRRRARPTEVGQDGLTEAAAPDELDRALQAWQVADAMATLSQAHRAVLVETYYRGRSVTEAAVTLGVPAGTVKSRCYYALRALRLALDEQGWDV
jgi:RNA polymerase sigma-70 factor (ECF subfamily)